MPRVAIEVSGIPSMVIDSVLRKDFIFMLWNCWVCRYLDAELLSSLYMLICLFHFPEMSYFSNLSVQGILFSRNLEITLDTMNILRNIWENCFEWWTVRIFLFSETDRHEVRLGMRKEWKNKPGPPVQRRRCWPQRMWLWEQNCSHYRGKLFPIRLWVAFKWPHEGWAS